MLYNVDYLIAALIFLVIVWNHFTSLTVLKDTKGILFRVCMVAGIIDIIMDIITCFTISLCNPAYNVLNVIANTIFYLLQAAFPLYLLIYTTLLRNIPFKLKKKKIIFWSCSASIMAVVILMNVVTGWLFTFDSYGMYTHGPLYLLMYAYSLGVNVVIGTILITRSKEFSERQRDVLWEFLVIALCCVGIQAMNNSLMMTGFGIGLGLVILLLTLNNPYSQTDNLTQMLDQKSFENYVDELMEGQTKFHLVVINLLQLRQINSVLGVQTGDSLILEIISKIQEVTNDTIFRISGKRFVILSKSDSQFSINKEKIQQLFENDFVIDSAEIYFPSLIYGIENPRSLQDSDSLLSFIEYLSSVNTDETHTKFVEVDRSFIDGFYYEQEIKQYLNVAIEKDLFDVYYQPVYSVKKEEYVTLEALSRLKHPEYGYISPDVFITLAEKSGQISELGYLQFKRICRFVDENRELMTLIYNIKFNLSSVDILNQKYIQSLIDLIHEYNLPSSFFQFEITETMATVYTESLYESIQLLNNEGIGICLDDFGSGYANLNTVLNLPFKAIKIDRSLLNGISTDIERRAFYKGIVSIFLEIGYYVISEGVETKEELDLLSSWHVTMIQGYYFSKPISQDKIIQELVLKNKGENI